MPVLRKDVSVMQSLPAMDAMRTTAFGLSVGTRG